MCKQSLVVMNHHHLILACRIWIASYNEWCFTCTRISYDMKQDLSEFAESNQEPRPAQASSCLKSEHRIYKLKHACLFRQLLLLVISMWTGKGSHQLKLFSTTADFWSIQELQSSRSSAGLDMAAAAGRIGCQKQNMTWYIVMIANGHQNIQIGCRCTD